MIEYTVLRGPDVIHPSVRVIIHGQPANDEGSTDRHRALVFREDQTITTMRHEIEAVVRACDSQADVAPPSSVMGNFTLLN